MKAIKIERPKGLVFLGDTNHDEVMHFALNCEYGTVEMSYQSEIYPLGYGCMPVYLRGGGFALTFNKVVVEAVCRARKNEELTTNDFIDLNDEQTASANLEKMGVPMEGEYKEHLDWVDINGNEVR